jgi:hypothetical protein
MVAVGGLGGFTVRKIRFRHTLERCRGAGELHCRKVGSHRAQFWRTDTLAPPRDAGTDRQNLPTLALQKESAT